MSKKKDNYTKHHITGAQIAGVLLMTAGIALIVIFSAAAYKETARSREAAQTEYENLLEEGLDPDSADSWVELHRRNTGIYNIPMIVVGGLLLLGSAPLFYAPYTDKGHKLRRSTQDDAEKYSNDDLNDPEFDYPDDDFDYIVDEEIRVRLIKERKRKIREKQRQQKRRRRR